MVGCADLSGLPETATLGFPRAVSIVVAYEAHLVPVAEGTPTPDHASEEDRVRALRGELATECFELLAERGWRVARAPAKVTDKENYTAPLSHKMVATKAGLGWVGKNDLLTTRDFGPAVKLASILTDAPLPVAVPVIESSCGDCRQCVTHCPGQAMTGENWRAGSPRENVLSVQACVRARRKRSEEAGLSGRVACDVCVAVCPRTISYSRRSH